MSNAIICELKHGVRLTVTDNSSELSIVDVVQFLAEAMQHFRKLGGRKSTSIYSERGYSSEVGDDTLELSHPGDPLPVNLWTEAVAYGFSVAQATEGLVDDVDNYRESDEATGGTMRHTLSLLDLPGGDLLAMVEVNRGFLSRHP